MDASTSESGVASAVTTEDGGDKGHAPRYRIGDARPAPPRAAVGPRSFLLLRRGVAGRPRRPPEKALTAITGPHYGSTRACNKVGSNFRPEKKAGSVASDDGQIRLSCRCDALTKRYADQYFDRVCENRRIERARPFRLRLARDLKCPTARHGRPSLALKNYEHPRCRQNRSLFFFIETISNV